MSSVEHVVRSRAEKLAHAHAELSRLVKQLVALPPDQCLKPIWSEGARALGGVRCVIVSVPELWRLLQSSMVASARDLPERRAHALLHVSMEVARLALAAEDKPSVSPRAIAAVQLLQEQAREWLLVNNVVVMQPEDRAGSIVRHREREPAARWGRRRPGP